MFRKCIPALIIYGLISPLSCYANTFTDKLQNVVSEIHVTKKNLSASEKKHKKLQDKLRKQDTNISVLEKKIAKTQNELQQLQKNLKELTTQQRELQKRIDGNQTALSKQIKSAYMLGNKNTIKMLLNQENPNDFERMIQYHRHIGKNRQNMISTLNKTISKININKRDIEKESNQLIIVRKKLIDQKKAMHLNHKKRRELLYTISSAIRTHHQKLNELESNKNQLEATIHRLQTNKANATEYFTAHHKKLPWPTKGKITIPFGTRIQNSHLKWSGVLIKAKEGQQVKAIAPGKVVFSNWMPGFGLLLILDHGDGYMSLYGRNNSLYRSTDDWVKAGDLIASVGVSGGHSKPALYFSLRHKGKPLDPTEWCNKTGKTA